MTPHPLRVLFRVAAGPQVGFGHLARSRSLSRALGVTPLVSVRGSLRTRSTAAALGWLVVEESNDDHLGDLDLDLMIVDDPCYEEADRWVRKARRLGVPVASIHDLGIGLTDADLVIDGGIAPGMARDDVFSLRGPDYTILDPNIARLRMEGRPPVFGRVLIALGGGAHIYPLAGRLTRALIARLPALDIHVACGFAPPRRLPQLMRASWVTSPEGLGRELANATVSVLAGGITLYEACALRVPAVAIPVTEAQHETTRALALHGAVIDAGWPTDDVTIERAANAVAALFEDSKMRERLSRDAGRVIDGDGVYRVASQLRRLAGARIEEASDAA